MPSSTQPLEEITDFSIEIMSDMQLADEDVDFCSFDETFDDVMDEMMQLESAQQNNFSHCDAPTSMGAFQDAQDTDVDETMNHPEPEPIQSLSHGLFTGGNNNDHTQFHDASLSAVTGPRTGIQLNSSEDLDGQIKNSMSKLVESMHRSEMSRNMLYTQQSSSRMFGLDSFLNGYSSLASGIAQRQSTFKNYMNHVGNSSTL